MTSVSRINQAVLLLKERLEQLSKRTAQQPSAQTAEAGAAQADPLAPLRLLARQGQIAPAELRKAFVRILLAQSLGAELVASLEFQSIADQVAGILEESESGRDLITRALAELG